MPRRTLDLLLSWTGLVVAVVLLVAGGLLLWGSSFVETQVRDQLAEQRIFFPPAESPAVQGPEFADVREYGGEQLLTGPQAEAYANDFIGVHLEDVADGRTYAEVSGEALADPGNEQLQEQAQTLFRGNALRGLLLNAYAFWTVSQIAFAAALVSLIGGAVLIWPSFRQAAARHRRSRCNRDRARQRDAARSLRPSVSLICGDLLAPGRLFVTGCGAALETGVAARSSCPQHERACRQT